MSAAQAGQFVLHCAGIEGCPQERAYFQRRETSRGIVGLAILSGLALALKQPEAIKPAVTAQA